MNLQSPISQTERRLAICLALIAGYVDAYGFNAFATYVSFMSGNTTQAGSVAGQGNLVVALPSAVAIVFFVAGSFAGTWLTHSELRRSRQFLFGVVAALLAVIIGVTQSTSLDAVVGIATLSLAMGMLNTALSRVGAEAVSLTFVTGTLNRLGSHLALALKHEPLPNAQGPWDTHSRRAFLLAGIWAGFLSGALLEGAATLHFGGWILLLPLLILLALTAFSSQHSQSMKESHYVQAN